MVVRTRLSFTLYVHCLYGFSWPQCPSWGTAPTRSAIKLAAMTTGVAGGEWEGEGANRTAARTTDSTGWQNEELNENNWF